MANEVIMPKSGPDMEEGQIAKWLKKEGDKVAYGEPLLEIVTDKVNMEIEAEDEGVLLKIVHGEGETVPVVTTIAWIGEEGEEIPEVNAKVEVKEEKKEEVKQEVKAETKQENSSGDEYDIVVIGGGPAGYAGAIRAAQLGGKVAIIEKDELGGTCLNRGCIPAKTFLHNTEILHGLHDANDRGIVVDTNFSVDMKKLVAYKNKVVKTLTGGVKALLSSNSIDMFFGEGVITKDKNVEVNGQVLKCKKILLASGSKVNRLNLASEDSKIVLTSDEIFDIDFVPKSLAVVGGGVIGCELGQAFASYGTEVTIIQRGDRIVPNMDAEISKTLESALKKEGITILKEHSLTKIDEKNNKATLHFDGKDSIEADLVLLSIGRVPDLSPLKNIDLDMDRNRVKVNEKMQTSDPDIYAVGDVNGKLMLAHTAYRMAEVAAENALGENHDCDLSKTPSIIYTLPECASVGLTEEEAKAKYGNIKVGRFNFGANGRALAAGQTTGFVKVIINEKYEEVVGVHIIGPTAAELINECGALMTSELTVSEVLKAIHGHPTFSEAVYEAYADSLGVAVHVPKRK